MDEQFQRTSNINIDLLAKRFAMEHGKIMLESAVEGFYLCAERLYLVMLGVWNEILISLPLVLTIAPTLAGTGTTAKEPYQF